MGKQTFGGDDDTTAAPEEAKKPKLSKFELTPDMNIRDVFWKVMASYATTKQPGVEPQKLHEHRFTFIKIALSLLERKEGHYYGMSNQLMVRYLLMLFLDNGWSDAAQKLLEEMKEGREDAWVALVNALKHLLKTEKEKTMIIALLKAMIRNTDAYPAALFYIAAMKDREVVAQLKKELYIFARGDTEKNQMNAIASLALLDDDEEAAKMIASLLSHWDAEVRRMAAADLKGMRLNDEAIQTIKTKLNSEKDEETKKILERIVVKWKK